LSASQTREHSGCTSWLNGKSNALGWNFEQQMRLSNTRPSGGARARSNLRT
jgi:hypothetical protein